MKGHQPGGMMIMLEDMIMSGPQQGAMTVMTVHPHHLEDLQNINHRTEGEAEAHRRPGEIVNHSMASIFWAIPSQFNQWV